MATIKRSISARADGQGLSEILLRVSVSMNVKFRLKSGVRISASRFRDGRIAYPRANQREAADLRRAEGELQRVEAAVLDLCARRKPGQLSRELLQGAADAALHPELADGDGKELPFFEAWEDFLASRDVSENRLDMYRVLGRALHRYEARRRLTREPGYALSVGGADAGDLADFEHFYRNEWRYYEEIPEVYADYPAELRASGKPRPPKRRGDNYVINAMKRLKTFFRWCALQGLSDGSPFDRYGPMKPERYGTPYYLTLAERDLIAGWDFSAEPSLAAQRDIFVFQCLVGCRVSDLRQLRKSSLVGDMLEYVPQKTKKESAERIRVPLCERAMEIASRYSGLEGEALLPCISDQKYNSAIKRICRACGIERMVTVIDPVSGKDERRRICDIASSHMARRTFIGNLYKKVKDASLVSSLSGHKEGSRAFARYREIDDEMKREIIGLIE